MLFSSKNISHYLLAMSAVLIASYVANKYRNSFETNDDYDLIKKYLLNDSPLYGFNRPKIWIHSKYEINARKWKDFQSRNTTDLNQPYLHLTIKTIINHCGNDFNVCLIDDESFSKLIPSWDVDLANVAEPMRSHFRELGMAQLLYYYGGMVVPNSFLCRKNLKDFFNEHLVGKKPFVCENINRTVNNLRQKHKLLFVPDLFFMGAMKNDPTILELVEHLQRRNKNHHLSSESDFTGENAQWCLDKINQQKMNLVGGEYIGVKSQDRRPILLENLMEEGYLNLNANAVGIYIPADEILIRPKFQWFAVMSTDQILKSNIIISKYLMASIIDTTSEYTKSTEVPSVVSI
jgi:hypothetical protein